MVVANSSSASFFIINQLNRLVDVMWFGSRFESPEITFCPFQFESQEENKGFLS